MRETRHKAPRARTRPSRLFTDPRRRDYDPGRDLARTRTLINAPRRLIYRSLETVNSTVQRTDRGGPSPRRRATSRARGRRKRGKEGRGRERRREGRERASGRRLRRRARCNHCYALTQRLRACCRLQCISARIRDTYTRRTVNGKGGRIGSIRRVCVCVYARAQSLARRCNFGYEPFASRLYAVTPIYTTGVVA